MSDFKFEPALPSVNVGDRVTYMTANKGQFPHFLRIEGPSGTFNVLPAGAQNVAVGASASGTFTFDKEGTYTYWCPVGMHRARGMEGTFRVVAVGAATAGATAAAPAAALPRTGDPVGMIGAVLASAGALLTVGGWAIRRKS